MKKYKRLVSLLLASIMIFGCMSSVVLAEDYKTLVLSLEASKSELNVTSAVDTFDLAIKNNAKTPIAAIEFFVLCNPDEFSCVSSSSEAGTIKVAKRSNGYKVSWYNDETDSTDETIAVMSFEASTSLYDGKYVFDGLLSDYGTDFDETALYEYQFETATVAVDGKDPDPISGVEMTLDVDEFGYDATEKAPKLVIGEGVTYTVSGDLKATDAGEYKITVTGTGKYQGTKELTWKINKAPLTVTGVSAVDKEYNNSTEIAVASSEIKWTGVQGSDSVNVTAPAVVNVDSADAGTYNVEIPLTVDNVNYTVAAVKDDVVISKAIVAQPAQKNAPVAYTGNEQEIYVNGTGYTVTEGGKGTNAGTYTAKFALENDNNYTWAEGVQTEVEWTIEKAAKGEVEATAKTLLYSNTDTQNLSVAELLKGTALENAGAAEVTAVAVTGADADVVEKTAFEKDTVSFNLNKLEEKEYAFNIEVTFNSKNYADGSKVTVPYSVIKKTLLVDGALAFAEDADATAEFTGKSVATAEIPAAAYTGDLTDYEISYKFYQNDVAVDAVEAGSYKLVATFEHATHYGTAEIDFEITKKPVTVKSATVAPKTYGEALETTVSDVIFNGVVEGFEIVDSEYTTSNAVFTNGNAGEQNVTFELTLDTKNYKYEAGTATVKGTIAPAKVTVTVAEIADQVYTGSKIEPKPVVTYGETELKNVAYVYEENVDCGTYTVKVNATAGGNYTFDETPVEFKIVEAEPKVTVADLTKDYDAAAVTLDDLTKTALFNGAAVEGTWTSDIETAAKADAGTYEVKVSFDPENENLKTVEKTVTVKIKPIDAVVVNEIDEAGKTLADVLTVIDLAKDDVTVEWFADEKGEEKLDAETEIEANTTYYYTVTSKTANFNTVTLEEITPYEVIETSGSSVNLVPGSTKHGSVSINPYNPESGDKVVITVKPAAGYEVDEVIVLDKDDDEVKVKEAGSNKYLFVMPAGQVDVKVTYKKANEVKFNDVADNAWYADAVYSAVDMGLFNGVTATTFNPDGSMTRGMLVTVLWRLEGSPAAGSSDFSDVANGSWYDEAVAWANEEGIVTGMTEDTFAPNAAITREQMATMLYRYAKYLGLNTRAKADLSAYKDADSISAYAEDAMAWAVGVGLINGVTETTLNPAGTATRAQVATILVRFSEKYL